MRLGGLCHRASGRIFSSRSRTVRTSADTASNRTRKASPCSAFACSAPISARNRTNRFTSGNANNTSTTSDAATAPPTIHQNTRQTLPVRLVISRQRRPHIPRHPLGELARPDDLRVAPQPQHETRGPVEVRRPQRHQPPPVAFGAHVLAPVVLGDPARVPPDPHRHQRLLIRGL